MRKLAVVALALPLLCARPASAAPPPEVLAWTTSAGAMVSIDGGTPQLAVKGALDVAVSRDGSKLATIRDVDLGGGLDLWRVFVSNIDGSGAVDLTPGNDGRNSYAYQPQFSPDGTRIAYAWGGGDVFNLRTIPTAGGSAVDIPDTDQTQMPSWSPDGAFLAAPTAGGFLLVTPDGKQRSLVAAAGHFFGDPAWSPDGTTILFNDTNYGGSGGPTHDLNAYSVATGVIAQLVPGASSAAWDADGQHFYDRSASGALERRSASGVLDPAFTAVAGADNPSVGGGTAPAPDAVAPGPVTGLSVTAGASQVTLHSTLPADADIAGVIVRYAQGNVAPATVTDGIPGDRAPSGEIVVRRLLADTQYSFSVFAVDWSGNVSAATSVATTTPHQVVTTFRTRTSRETVVYGGTVTESARLIREDTGGYVEGALVHLFGHAYKQPDKLLATARTDKYGLVQFVRRPTATAAYTLTYDGDGQLQPGTVTHRVKVAFKVIATVSPHIARRGARAVYDITVLPAIAGRQLSVAQVLGTRDLHNAVFHLDAHGHASVVLDTHFHGNEYLFTYVPAYADYAPREVQIGFGVA
jgi:chitodextrinase